MRVFLCASLAIITTAPAFASDNPAKDGLNLSLSWNVSHERLSIDSPSWRSEELGLTTQFAKHNTLYLALRRSERFGLRDLQLEANYTIPLQEQLIFNLGGNYSSKHQIMPAHQLWTNLQYTLAKGWLAHAGLRYSSYSDQHARQFDFALEHYAGPWRYQLNWRPNRIYSQTGDLGIHSSGLALDYFYADDSKIGLQASFGKESIQIQGLGLQAYATRSIALTGKHRLSQAWLLRYGIEHVRQGDLYNRRGIYLGAQYQL